MNIDIVNTQVAAKLKMKQSKVEHVNKFYWNCVKEHLYNLDPRPINISSLCVIHPTPFAVKTAIRKYILRIRNLRNSKRYKENSETRERTLQYYHKYLRGFWAIRKEYKYTN